MAEDVWVRVHNVEMKISAADRLAKMAAEKSLCSTGDTKTAAQSEMDVWCRKVITLREELRTLLTEAVNGAYE